jgi:hypothetical protein
MKGVYCVSQFVKCLQYWLSALVAPEPSVNVSSQRGKIGIAAHYSYNLVWTSVSSKLSQLLHTRARQCSVAWRCTTLLSDTQQYNAHSLIHLACYCTPCFILILPFQFHLFLHRSRVCPLLTPAQRSHDTCCQFFLLWIRCVVFGRRFCVWQVLLNRYTWLHLATTDNNTTSGPAAKITLYFKCVCKCKCEGHPMTCLC